jgi:DNA mismatch endonuclease (patch repair protein)
MADNRTKEQRSYNMSRIRSKNTKPEILVRRFLFAKGIRFRLHSKQLEGRPDIVIHKLKAIVFVHGCFWHGHRNCKNAKIPASNRTFWVKKFTTNAQRDRRTIVALKKDGWKVFVLWECQLGIGNADNTLSKFFEKLLRKD